MKSHTVQAFDEELSKLNEHILRMGGIAEAQIAGAVEALQRRDPKLAGKVIANDQQIDGLEQQVQDAAVTLLALRQPMADDLRTVVGTIKIAAELERVGDYAANIAKRATVLAESPPMGPAGMVPLLGKVVEGLLRDSLNAFAARDAAKARHVWRSDEEADQLYTGLFRELLTYMMEDPRNITPCTHLLFIAKNLERIGDHATNIAETVNFLVKGESFKGERPKGDESSYTDVAPAAS